MHLYVHIPFCRRRCGYCSFAAVTVSEPPEEAWLAAVKSEFRLRRRAAGSGFWQPLETLYFGGGTPSLLSPAFYADCIAFLAFENGFAAHSEITLEANPADLDGERLAGYRAAGINRLSLGIQTLSDRALLRLGRRHDAAAARRAVVLARAAGFANLNLDLIVAWPEETLAALDRDLDGLLAFAPEHLSCYLLTLEPDTRLGREAAAGRLSLPDEERQVALLERVRQRLAAAGYLHYEISNYARKARFRSRHNLAVWRLSDYLGLGAGACGGFRLTEDSGRFPGVDEGAWLLRYRNHPDPRFYLRRLQRVAAGESSGGAEAGTGAAFSWAENEFLGREAILTEAVMLGLRLREGIDLARLAELCGESAAAVLQRRAAPLLATGRLEWVAPGAPGSEAVATRRRLRVAPEALWLTDEIVLHLV